MNENMTKMNFQEIPMRHISLKILTVGDRKVPEKWHISQRVKMHRLYYIKGGTGWMNDGHGGKIPFEKGKIYIQPYNLEADFVSDPQDPIDHVYYDFLSTPPIISEGPIVYTPSEGSTVEALIRGTECFCRELADKGIISRECNYLPPYMLNKDSKFGLVFRGILSALLTALSLEKALPFAEDMVVVETLDVIRKNYKNAISINRLAADAGFEVHYFIRRFKQIMGTTPYAYLRAYRLIKATELIEGGMSIASAAAMVGYESPAALSRALKKEG